MSQYKGMDYWLEFPRNMAKQTIILSQCECCTTKNCLSSDLPFFFCLGRPYKLSRSRMVEYLRYSSQLLYFRPWFAIFFTLNVRYLIISTKLEVWAKKAIYIWVFILFIYLFICGFGILLLTMALNSGVSFFSWNLCERLNTWALGPGISPTIQWTGRTFTEESLCNFC